MIQLHTAQEAHQDTAKNDVRLLLQTYSWGTSEDVGRG